MQCSVIIVKGKETKHRMKLVLRAIAMLDCKIALVSGPHIPETNKMLTVKKGGEAPDEQDPHDRRKQNKMSEAKSRLFGGRRDGETAHKKAREIQDMDESG